MPFSSMFKTIRTSFPAGEKINYLQQEQEADARLGLCRKYHVDTNSSVLQLI